MEVRKWIGEGKEAGVARERPKDRNAKAGRLDPEPVSRRNDRRAPEVRCESLLLADRNARGVGEGNRGLKSSMKRRTGRLPRGDRRRGNTPPGIDPTARQKADHAGRGESGQRVPRNNLLPQNMHLGTGPTAPQKVDHAGRGKSSRIVPPNGPLPEDHRKARQEADPENHPNQNRKTGQQSIYQNLHLWISIPKKRQEGTRML